MTTDEAIAAHVAWCGLRGLTDTTIYQRQRVLSRLAAALPRCPAR